MALKFGKFKGKEVSELANSDEGLKYLHWLKEKTDPNDEKYGKQNKALLEEIDKAIANKTVYLSDKPKAKSSQNNSYDSSKLDLILSELETIKKFLGIKSIKNDKKPKTLNDYSNDEIDVTMDDSENSNEPF